MSKPVKISYALIFLLIVLVAWLGMATPFMAALFAYFALEKLSFVRNKWLTTGLFTVLVIAVFYMFGFFLKEAIVTLPKIASESVPSIIEFANKHDLKLPFDDTATLKAVALTTVKDQLGYLGNFAKIATKEFAFLVIGLVVAASMFINPTIDLDRGRHPIANNLYSVLCDELTIRIRGFYLSFKMVMGAQIIISLINTTLTGVFLLFVSLPYAVVVIGVTFMCGLLPIIGNLISNAVIVGIAFTISPKIAIAALVFLVILHKLEYFLNSKIIGDRIRNPVWLTLLGLIIGERLMGIPGMILAPVVLHYLKGETSRIEMGSDPIIPAPRERKDPPVPVDSAA